MDKKEKDLLIDEKQTEIIALEAALRSHTSEIGDYHIIKIYEARLMGRPDPYDAEELIARRDEARARINELQQEIDELRGESK